MRLKVSRPQCVKQELWHSPDIKSMASAKVLLFIMRLKKNIVELVPHFTVINELR